MQFDDSANDGGTAVMDAGDPVDRPAAFTGGQVAHVCSAPEPTSVHPKFPQAKRVLRVMFLTTDMRVGGAEMVTANILRRIDRSQFSPELCCLKSLGEMGEALADEIPVHHDLLRNRYDVCVLLRLRKLLRTRKIDAVVTVGAGDKMFWGRLAARWLKIPVIISALHSTGWPDGVGRLNRRLTPITDAFIAVAEAHGKHLIEHERFPADRVTVIPNGVDTQKFAPTRDHTAIRCELGLDPAAPVVGIVAALRPEKNHTLFLEMASRVARQWPDARFLIVGDGPCREDLERQAAHLGLSSRTLFLGCRNDVPRLLHAMDVFALTSHIEANPISILEVMSTGLPVVATRVGSIHEAVIDRQTGYLVQPGDADQLAGHVLNLLKDGPQRRAIGAAARQCVVEKWSIESMVSGYERLIASIYHQKLAAAMGVSP